MSATFQLAFARCLRRLSLRISPHFVGSNPSVKMPFGPGINYFMPKTSNLEPMTVPAQNGYDLKVPDGFIVIYRFEGLHLIKFTSYASALLALAGTWLLYEHMVKQEYASVKENISFPTEASESIVQNEKNWFYLPQGANSIFDGSGDIYNLAALPFVILLLLCMRTRVVLCSWRRGNEYITMVTKRFGFGSKIVKHGPQEVYCFPSRKFYKHQLHGDGIILFPEYFINKEEEQLMCFGGGFY